MCAHLQVLSKSSIPLPGAYFEKEFSRKSFNATRAQIKDRLYAVLSIPTFDRLFSAPKSKINFFDALNSGKIILIDTAKGLLKEEGAAIFECFMLALIEHAISERANIPESERNPVFLYMDEAHEYFDDTVETMIIEARKFKCGLTLAHQNLAQLRSPKLRAIFTGNTTIKIAGGVTDQDARSEIACSINATRQQIKDRLYAVLSIPTFDRLFSAPRSKINFFDALNSGKSF